MLLNSFPGFFGAGTIITNVVKTLIFNPLTVPPLLFTYNSMKYVRDYVGVNPIKFVSKIGTMCKRAVFTIKQETKDIFLYMSPLHYIQFNYLPNAPLRMLQSALVNNPIFRYVTARKEGKAKLQEEDNIVSLDKARDRYLPKTQEPTYKGTSQALPNVA
ncbi:MAG: hypothetical protein U9O94_00325 [Nanoarchaeota archaeon]|nr:hypothetical protein [Nanoarchaeota archaeon]